MRKVASFLLLACTGCSTAPIADFLDAVRPGRLEAAPTDPFGGGVVMPPEPLITEPEPFYGEPPPPDPVNIE